MSAKVKSPVSKHIETVWNANLELVYPTEIPHFGKFTNLQAVYSWYRNDCANPAHTSLEKIQTIYAGKFNWVPVAFNASPPKMIANVKSSTQKIVNVCDLIIKIGTEKKRTSNTTTSVEEYCQVAIREIEEKLREGSISWKSFPSHALLGQLRKEHGFKASNRNLKRKATSSPDGEEPREPPGAAGAGVGGVDASTAD